jgi:glucosamine--fructose-6-phosphate aminotransferase (isomerizing)
MINEIREIPDKAEKILYSTKNIQLPLNVPYIGMGSSYYATLAMYYQGIPIQPSRGSEYYNYLSGKKVKDLGVLISQSGRSSEVIWCRDLFKRFYAITNVLKSPLCVSTNLERVFPLLAGKELASSTKTYIITLITLYNGLGVDPTLAVEMLRGKMYEYEKWGQETAGLIYELIIAKNYKGSYIIGNGPNISTVHQAAHILSESTKYPFIGMSVSEYDHGPKETAKDSIVIVMKSDGVSYRRTKKLFELVQNAGAHVFYYEDKDVPEAISPITSVVPLMFMTHYLSKLFKIQESFVVGSKVTEA